MFKNSDTIATLIKQFNWKMANIYDNLCLVISEFLNFTKDMGDFQALALKNNPIMPYKKMHGHPFELLVDKKQELLNKKPFKIA